MTDRPILFSAPMVRALLAGTKTQTRRVVKPGRGQPFLTPELLRSSPSAEFVPNLGVFKHPAGGPLTCVTPPYGVPGDRLWVRETWSFIGQDGIFDLHQARPGNCKPIYRADGVEADRWWPSIHMYRWASRLTLKITEVRVERLNDISEADALAEGVRDLVSPDGARGWNVKIGNEIIGTWVSPTPRDIYETLWDHINGPGAWAANPWVWAVSFEVEA